MKPAGTSNKYAWIFGSVGPGHKCIPLLTTRPHTTTCEQTNTRCRHAHTHALPFVITALLCCKGMETGETHSVFRLKGKKEKKKIQTKLSEQLFLSDAERSFLWLVWGREGDRVKKEKGGGQVRG